MDTHLFLDIHLREWIDEREGGVGGLIVVEYYIAQASLKLTL